VLASRLNMMPKAYELYLRTSRLDLDDYNVEVAEGLHITSMAGTWMAVVQGFGGMRVYNDHLYLKPQLPDACQSYSFKIRFRGNVIKVKAYKSHAVVENYSNTDVEIFVFGNKQMVKAKSNIEVKK